MRRFSRLLLLALVVAVAGVYPLLAPTPHRIDQAHFDLIEPRMTVGHVEAIFGVPAGSYDWAEQHPYLIVMIDDFSHSLGLPAAAPPGQLLWDGRWIGESREPVLWQTWICRHGAFTVGFDSQGEVLRKQQNGTRIVPPWQRWWKVIWTE
jgi:hypothetical protein